MSFWTFYCFWRILWWVLSYVPCTISVPFVSVFIIWSVLLTCDVAHSLRALGKATYPPVDIHLFPALVHLVSLMPTTVRLFYFISATTCASLAVSNTVYTFHVPMFILLVERRFTASFWFSPPKIICLWIVEHNLFNKLSMSLVCQCIHTKLLLAGYGCLSEN